MSFSDKKPQQQQRQPACGDTWQEYFVDQERASYTASVGDAVAQSLSYVTIRDFATIDERMALQTSALELQQELQEQQAFEFITTTTTTSTTNNHHHHHNPSYVLGATQSAAHFNCTRYSVQALLNTQAKQASATLFHRLLCFLQQNDNDNENHNENHTNNDTTTTTTANTTIHNNNNDEMSELANAVFDDEEFRNNNTTTTSSATTATTTTCKKKKNLHKMQVEWYQEPDNHGRMHPEPKVNIYTKGGYFTCHEDGMHLTLLVVLSDAFEGGGTAFFKETTSSSSTTTTTSSANTNNANVAVKNDGDNDDDDDDHRNNNNNTTTTMIEPSSSSSSSPLLLEPDSIAKPPAGTAIIWGKKLLHMALPVTAGMRAVYVGSFDLKNNL